MIENRIREIRTSHGLSQEALATIIDSTQQSISRMENNTQAITAKALIMMSEYFMSPQDIFLVFLILRETLTDRCE